MSSIYDWSVTPINNANSDSGITLPEGMNPGLVNDAMRAGMGRQKEWVLDLGGSIVSGGTASVMTATLYSAVTEYFDGLIFAVRHGTTNTGATTMNPNALGGKPIKVFDGTSGEIDPKAGQIRLGNIGIYAYSSIANSGNGAFILLNPASAGSSEALFEYRIPYNTSTTMTSGGGGFTTWPLDTEISDPGALATLSANTLTVAQAAMLEWEAYASAVATTAADSTIVKTHLFCVTDNVSIKTGSIIGVGTGASGVSRISGLSTGKALVAAGKQYRIRYYVFTTGGSANFNGWSSIGAPDLGDVLSLQVSLKAV